MSDEKEIKTKKDLWSVNEYMKKFLVVALGSFVGVYCALCMFMLAYKSCLIKPYYYGFKMHKPAFECACKKKIHPKTFKPDIKKDVQNLEQHQQILGDKPPMPPEGPKETPEK